MNAMQAKTRWNLNGNGKSEVCVASVTCESIMGALVRFIITPICECAESGLIWLI